MKACAGKQPTPGRTTSRHAAAPGVSRRVAAMAVPALRLPASRFWLRAGPECCRGTAGRLGSNRARSLRVTSERRWLADGFYGTSGRRGRDQGHSSGRGAGDLRDPTCVVGVTEAASAVGVVGGQEYEDRFGARVCSRSRSLASSRSNSRCPASGLAPLRQRCTVRTLTRSKRASSRQESPEAAWNSSRRAGKSGGKGAGSVR